jgi:RimJ/RimL family protein N-acetyltransferase
VFQELARYDFESMRPLLDTVPHHLTAAAVVDGTCPGRIWADNTTAPRTALLDTPEGHIIAGELPQDDAREGLRALIVDTRFAFARQEGWWRFGFASPGPDWEPLLAEITGARYPVQMPRQHYLLTRLAVDWREGFPAGFAMEPIDVPLLACDDVANVAQLRSWAEGNFGSLADFARLGFGCCAREGRTIASWCLSDCVSGARAEVGIHTDAAYRRRGLATRVVAAAVEIALGRDLTHLGWHCTRANVASAATARAVGFEHARDYRDLHLWFNDCDACLANGNVAFMEAHYAGAAEWFARGFAQADAPASRLLAKREDQARYRYKAAVASAMQGDGAAAAEQVQAALDASNDRWTGV